MIVAVRKAWFKFGKKVLGDRKVAEIIAITLTCEKKRVD